MYIRTRAYIHTYIAPSNNLKEICSVCTYVRIHICVCVVSSLAARHTVCTYVCMCVQSDLTYLHTPVMNESGDKAKELDK